MRGKHAGVYDPGTAGEWRKAVRQATEAIIYATADTYFPLSGPLYCELEVLLPRPERLMRKKDPEGALWAPNKRDDVDNLAKAILDAMTEAGAWEDDGQIVRLEVLKKWHAKGESPGAVISFGKMLADP